MNITYIFMYLAPSIISTIIFILPYDDGVDGWVSGKTL